MKQTSPYKITYAIGLTSLVIIVMVLCIIFLQIYSKYVPPKPFGKTYEVTYDTIHKPIIVWDTIEKPFFRNKPLTPNLSEKKILPTEEIDSIK